MITIFTLTIGDGKKAISTNYNDVHRAYQAFKDAVNFDKPVHVELYNKELGRAIFRYNPK
jgi:hypothetical protein